LLNYIIEVAACKVHVSMASMVQFGICYLSF